MPKPEKGFIPIIILVLILVVVAGGAYYFLKIKTPTQKACTLEAKICPDGSSVGRTGPNCEFTPCPNSSRESTDSAKTTNWKTYNGKYFSFEYPSSWQEQTSPAKNLPENLEVIGLKISQNAVFEASAGKTGCLKLADYTKRENIVVGNKNAVRIDLKGGADPVSDPKSVFMIEGFNDAKCYHIVFSGDRNYFPESLIKQILSTFKFLDQNQVSPEGKPCGGFAGEKGDLICPTGYKCQYPQPMYPDAQGKCVKKNLFGL